jgi:hypothetical protein
MGHPAFVMQIKSVQGEAHAITVLEFRNAALEIRLRAGASFREKLRQLIGKCPAKRAPKSALSQFQIGGIRRKF